MGNHQIRGLSEGLATREGLFERGFNPLTPISDQDRISPYIINTISSRQVMKIRKISIRGLLVDPIPNSPN